MVVSKSRKTTKPHQPHRTNELRGKPIEVLRTLLMERRDDDVISLVTALVARNAELEKQLALVRGRVKNASERVPSEQLALFLALLDAQPEGRLADAAAALEKAAEEHGARPPPNKPPKQPPVRRPPPPGLRRVDNPIVVPAAERPCPACGAERRCIAHETTEVLELVPAEVIVRRDRREVLACDRCDAEMVRAPMGDKVVPGGAYGSGLVSQMVVDKYRDGLPLYRIGHRLATLGLDMPSASMSDQIQWATELLRPLHRAALACMLVEDVLHLDGTSIPVRDKETGHQVHLGSLWGYIGGPHAVYLFTSTGKKNGVLPGELGPEDVLALRTGPVVADASNLFDKSFEREDLIEVGCNMHARRYFVKALEAGDARAAVAIKAFQALYAIEDETREAGHEARLEQRRVRSRPVYDQLLAWGELHRPEEPPASKLGEALRYLDNHRVALTRFLDDGRLPIDNGVIERLHRRPAIVRRNMLFAGSYDGARRAAVAFTILASCDLAGVDPIAYLRDVLPRIARSGGLTHAQACALLPAAWKAAQATS
jgi:transposase